MGKKMNDFIDELRRWSFSSNDWLRKRRVIKYRRGKQWEEKYRKGNCKEDKSEGKTVEESRGNNRQAGMEIST